MYAVEYFFWLAGLGFEVGVFLFPVLSLFAVAGLVTAGFAACHGPELPWDRWAWLHLPFLIPPAILAYGVAFNYRGPVGSTPAWRGLVIDVLVWSHVPIGLALLRLCRKCPLVPIGLTAFQMWLSFCMAFVSSMSVTNRWL